MRRLELKLGFGETIFEGVFCVVYGERRGNESDGERGLCVGRKITDFVCGRVEEI